MRLLDAHGMPEDLLLRDALSLEGRDAPPVAQDRDFDKIARLVDATIVVNA